MSFATHIKEFADILNDISSNHLSPINPAEVASAITDTLPSVEIPRYIVLQQALIYGIKNLGSGLVYFLTFQWFRDISYLPLLTPEIGHESVLADTFLSEPGSYLFSLSRIPNHKTDYLLAGFVNSFFFSLPFSLPYLVTLRRLFSQGVRAAVASILGTVIAHSLVLMGVLYGLRFLIIPYHSFQPLTFLVGLCTISVIINELVQEKKIYLLPLKHSPSIVRIGVLNFVLTLCEETSLYHPFRHLTLNQQNTYLQLYSSNSSLDSFFVHTFYLLTFVFGHLVFSFFFCYMLLKVNEQLCFLNGWTIQKTAQRINRFVLLLIVTLTFSSFPYYGLDYLFTKIGGFLPEDPVLGNTIFSPSKIKARNRHFTNKVSENKNEKSALELDLSYFDRGMYLDAPKKEDKEEESNASKKAQKEDQELSRSSDAKKSSEALTDLEDTLSETDFNAKKTDAGSRLKGRTSQAEGLVGAAAQKKALQDRSLDSNASRTLSGSQSLDSALTFEDLNYQGDYAWLMWEERAKNVDLFDEDNKNTLFKKPKNYFKELKLKQENRQAEAALKEHTPLGSLSKWKEGVLPSEMPLQEDPTLNESASTGTERLTGASEGKLDRSKAETTYVNPTFMLNVDDSLRSEPFLNKKRKQESSTSLSKEQKDDNKEATRIEYKHSFSSNPLNTKFELDDDTASSDSSDEDPIQVELALEKEIASDYSKSFSLMSSEESELKPRELLPVESIIKKRYLLNPVYKALLKNDIDTFLKRQPRHYKIAQNQEVSLYKKRQLLENYYNWLRYYSPIENSLYKTSIPQRLPASESTEHEAVHKTDPFLHPSGIDFLSDTKSFIESVYHQQFKGTLQNAKRLFKVTLDPEQNSKQNRVLSYDQTLYKRNSHPLHKAKVTKQIRSDKKTELMHPSLHEELFSNNPDNASNTTLQKDLNDALSTDVSPFLEESNSAPVYAGWDEKVRHFVITNRFQFF